MQGTLLRRRGRAFLVAGALAISAGAAARAGVIVNDTWTDGTRTDPASPTYSENGVDSDVDLSIESAWFNAGTGATLTPSVGHLVGAVAASSASWTTFFTPPGSPVTLANAGDQMKITWVFTPTNVNATNTSQNFRIATAQTSSGNRISTDAAPNSDTYTGYALFLNFAQTTGRSTPFQLLERTVLTSSDLLGTSANWGNAVNAAGFGNGAVGYASATTYTLVETFTRNGSNGVDIVATMTGGNINSTGSVSASETDATPSTFSYDTFALRPSNNTTTADSFDTTLFKVEFTPGVPEPTTAVSLGALGMIYLSRRRNRR